MGSVCLVGSETTVWESRRTNLEVTMVKLKDSSAEVTSSVTRDRGTQQAGSSFQLKHFPRFFLSPSLHNVTALHLVVAPLILPSPSD